MRLSIPPGVFSGLAGAWARAEEIARERAEHEQDRAAAADDRAIKRRAVEMGLLESEAKLRQAGFVPTAARENAYFGASRSPVSVDVDRSFRLMAITHFGRSRSSISLDVDQRFRRMSIAELR